MSQSDLFSKVTADYQAAFELIDVVFSLECCLRYQVLPLELSDNHLIVGMVNPKDKKAIQELNPIIDSFDYSFHIQALDAQIHQLVLVTYLKQGKFKNSSSEKVSDSSQIIAPSKQVKNTPETNVSRKSLDQMGTLIDIPPETNVSRKSLDQMGTLIDIPPETNVSRKSLDQMGTLIDIPPETNVSRKSLDQMGTLIDIPPETNVSRKSLDQMGTLIDIPPETNVSRKSLDQMGTLIDIPDEKSKYSSASNFHDRPTFIVNDAPQKKQSDQEASQLFFSEPQINNIEDENEIIPNSLNKVEQNQILEIKTNYVNKSLEFFQNSPPHILWQELLARILAKGIGRLYLQQQHNYGRIICSQDGVVQHSLDKVPFSIFEGVIKEIKMLAKLPLTKLEKTQKVAIQKFYNNERILLRIEFLLSQFGEEITIQVLRGQALHFYEQRQVSKNLDQAIYLGQKLEKTLKKMRMCNGVIDKNDLSALKVIMRQVEKQLKMLEL